MTSIQVFLTNSWDWTPATRRQCWWCRSHGRLVALLRCRIHTHIHIHVVHLYIDIYLFACLRSFVFAATLAVVVSKMRWSDAVFRLGISLDIVTSSIARTNRQKYWFWTGQTSPNRLPISHLVTNTFSWFTGNPENQLPKKIQTSCLQSGPSHKDLAGPWCLVALAYAQN